MRSRLLLITALTVLIGLLLGAYWWLRQPVLVVRVGPELAPYLDRSLYKSVFRQAGVRRVRLVESSSEKELGRFPPERVEIALVLSPDRNPELDEIMLARGLTGPGYTDRFTGFVYEPDVDLFLQKHRRMFVKEGLQNWEALKKRLITNTAIHESWHAIAQSTSHNPIDKKSVMYMNPGESPVGYANERLVFTAGHEVRLREMFAPVLPWNRS